MSAAQFRNPSAAQSRADPGQQGPSLHDAEDRARTADVARYYDANTRAFLRVGAGRRQRVIHRGVWGPGVRTRAEASHYVHDCLRRELKQLAGGASRLLDLGCGVGASLSYLLEGDAEATGVGVSISTVQVALAKRHAHARARFVVADFCQDALPAPVDLAYAIEAFVHASRADAFFTSVARSLRPGGRLVIVDDFLARSNHATPLVAEFQKGWHARSLLSPEATDKVARAAGLQLHEDRNLTPYLQLDRPRDRALAALASVLRPLASAHHALGSLVGGNALRACLAKGLITYRWRVWEKVTTR